MTAPQHGTGWREYPAGWSVVPGYCWCGRLARECPEPKIDVSAAAMYDGQDDAAVQAMDAGWEEFPHDE